MSRGGLRSGFGPAATSLGAYLDRRIPALEHKVAASAVAVAMTEATALAGWAGRSALAWALARELDVRAESVTPGVRQAAGWALAQGGAPADVRRDVLAILDVSETEEAPTFGDGRRLTGLSFGLVA